MPLWRRRWRRNAGAVALTLLTSTSVLPRPALAAEADGAAALIAHGVGLLKTGDYDGARRSFARAYAAAPTSSTLLRLALAELESGHAADAARHLRSYMERLDAPADKVEAIRFKWLPRAEAGSARLQIVAPAGAEIVVDERDEGRAPLGPLDLDAGYHEITVREGNWSKSATVTLALGQDADPLQFEGPPPPPPAAAVASAPIAASPPPERPAPSSTRSGSPTGKVVSVVAAGAAALVATGLGIGFAIASIHDANAANAERDAIRNPLDDECSMPPLSRACQALQSDTAAQDLNSRISDAFYIGAGALAVGALVTWFVWPAGKSARDGQARPLLVPFAGRDRAGLLLGGAW